MRTMFARADAFNQPIGRWNVSSVTDMYAMFYSESRALFNQPLDAWDVSKVTSMQRMFFFNQVFNQPLEAWDVSRVVDMSNMFAFARDFDQPLGGWNVSSVIDMGGMFFSLYGRNFRQNLCPWGPLLQGRSVVFQDPQFGRNIFYGTKCPSTANPNLLSSPPGPFCHACV
mmetsp:Transcript_24946/g.47374  ORF Transcript_24946/g.47374 Transcript_24946/m.47374 type:complete len:170 (+) Transcript_24946:2-511(+)